MRTRIRSVGNSLGNIIPIQMLRAMNLQKGSEIEIIADGNQIIIKPTQKAPPVFSENELLAGLDAHTAHADELAPIMPNELGV